VQSDDIQAESILAINIAAGTITAAQIAAGTITGNNISSSTTITAGSGNAIAVLNGASGILTDGTSELTDANGTPIRGNTWRIYAGNADPNIAPFRVEANGSVIAGNATIISGDGSVQLDDKGLKLIGDTLLGKQTVTFANTSNDTIATISSFFNPAGIPPEASLDISTGDAGAIQIMKLSTGNTYIDMGTIYGITLNTGGTQNLDFNTNNTQRMVIDYQGNISISNNSFVSIPATSEYRVGTNNVVKARITGWGAPSGTPTRTTFATGSVTLVQLAERVKALIDDLTTHGLIGPTPP
jgi:hypothetical protein